MLIDFSSAVHTVQSDGGPPDAGVRLQAGAPLCHQVPQSCHGRRVGQGVTKLSEIQIHTQVFSSSNLCTVFRARIGNHMDLAKTVVSVL